MDGRKFQRQYKKSISNYKDWVQKSHAEHHLLFPENLSTELSLDEVALSDGELYTVLTSKKGKGQKGSIVAIVKGTKSEIVIDHLFKISRNLRLKVQEITLDMASSMKLIAKRCFPNAIQVIDRFHVQKLATEALQEIRIKHRWEAMDKENEWIAESRCKNNPIPLELFENGDTRKQLLARSRYLLYKSREKWTESQSQRAKILFEHYPDIEKAYNITDQLRQLYNQRIKKDIAMTKLAHWFRDVENTEFKSFRTLIRTITLHYSDILNYFTNRSTNASAESFNAKIKN